MKKWFLGPMLHRNLAMLLANKKDACFSGRWDAGTYLLLKTCAISRESNLNHAKYIYICITIKYKVISNQSTLNLQHIILYKNLHVLSYSIMLDNMTSYCIILYHHESSASIIIYQKNKIHYFILYHNNHHIVPLYYIIFMLHPY